MIEETAEKTCPAGTPPGPEREPAVRDWPVVDLPALRSDPLFDELLAEEPVTRIKLPFGEGHAWLVTRYEDVKQVTSDPRFSRAEVVGRDVTRSIPAPVAAQKASLQYLDPPDHTRLRKVVARAFTARSMRRLRPMVEAAAERLLDEMERQGAPADVVTYLNKPFPEAVVSDLLGVPESDRPALGALGEQILTADADGEARMKARAAARQVVVDLLARRRAEPSEDLGGVLAEAAAQQEISEDEAISLATAIWISGGHAVTNNTANMVYALLTHPAQLARLRAEPELMPQAVDELLRYVPHRNGVGIPRIATEDVEVGGVLIKAGEVIYNSYLAANRDPGAFPDPHTLDFARPPLSHLSFGHGPHHCLAAALARMESEVLLSALLTRFPDLRLAVRADDIEWHTRTLIRGPKALPVAW
ncbi:cytochrome P450 [Streptomyces sp. A7024]|uniref:Cytochrome P450 n=1 Tax=Streptomyces coryli TaxID=1128680 RepID=A0A6G4U6N5_9ACTN|nr:cytochrome P450 [Streptomyces coryli]NGN67899.1 cytochrome P450 [Streptomyces coryli]